jgi:hypothetical protein
MNNGIPITMRGMFHEAKGSVMASENTRQNGGDTRNWSLFHRTTDHYRTATK